MNKQPPKELRNLGKYSTESLRSLMEVLKSPGISLLWTIFNDRFESIKHAEFYSKYNFDDRIGIQLFGNRRGQKDMMDYIQALAEEIQGELDIREKDIADVK